METKSMLYLVTEYAKNGEIFGKHISFNLLIWKMSVSFLNRVFSINSPACLKVANVN